MRLSDIYAADEYVADAVFDTLGQSDSDHAGTLAYCDSVHHLRRADANPSVSCLITTPELLAEVRETPGLIADEHPRRRFFALHQHLIQHHLLEPETAAGIGAGCSIHPSAIISRLARIGDHVHIGANVVVHDHVQIGSHTFVDSGAQLGVDGLLYVTDEYGNRCHVRHQGAVRIGRHCALLSQSVIVRSVHRGLATTLGDHCVIGIASNIGHEAQLGSNVVVSNHCVVARGAHLANHCHVGTASVIREYVCVADRAQVKPGSIVIADVAANQCVSGNYAIDHAQHLRDHLRVNRR
jgi:UDP-3-O-[3-hydroxymyristoyl] glucosamine N-acyltransferase